MTKLVTSFRVLDWATGGDLGVTGVARMTPGGGFGFSGLEAVGRNATARLDGDYRPARRRRASVDIPDAKASIHASRARFSSSRA